MLVGVEHDAAGPPEKSSERALRVGVDANRQQLDAMAHQSGQAFRRLARSRHADDDIVLSRQPRQQRGEGGEQRGEQAGAVAGAERLDRRDQHRFDDQFLPPRFEAANRRARPVAGKLEHRRPGRELPHPPVGVRARCLEVFFVVQRQRVIAVALGRRQGRLGPFRAAR